ncbi:transcription initiation factor IIA gamma chain [Pelomyxa schiedti]|nr:transcription initiation factor IIA gamma chain [Pelomyxa schiedti]
MASYAATQPQNANGNPQGSTSPTASTSTANTSTTTSVSNNNGNPSPPATPSPQYSSVSTTSSSPPPSPSPSAAALSSGASSPPLVVPNVITHHGMGMGVGPGMPMGMGMSMGGMMLPPQSRIPQQIIMSRQMQLQQMQHHNLAYHTGQALRHPGASASPYVTSPPPGHMYMSMPNNPGSPSSPGGGMLHYTPVASPIPSPIQSPVPSLPPPSPTMVNSGRAGMYTFYRKSSLGTALTDTLDDLSSGGQIPISLREKILTQFDKSVAQALRNQVQTKLTFNGHLQTYRGCDNVWTWILDKPVFKTGNEVLECNDKVKIVACDGRSLSDQPQAQKGKH